MLIFNNGGTMNGTTNKDRTLYFETLPANQLDLGIYLEADRMRSLEITKANLDNESKTINPSSTKLHFIILKMSAVLIIKIHPIFSS
jgi:hypothetical protein